MKNEGESITALLFTYMENCRNTLSVKGEQRRAASLRVLAVKMPYPLKVILYCYNSCTILKPVHCLLVLDINMGHRIWHKICNLKNTDSNMFLQKARGTAEKYLEFVASVHILLFPVSADFLFDPMLLQELITRNSIGTAQKLLSWSWTPIPPGSKMVVKPGTNRKHKMWWYSILYKAQFFRITTEETANKLCIYSTNTE